jgi:hypothetical protein
MSLAFGVIILLTLCVANLVLHHNDIQNITSDLPKDFGDVLRDFPISIVIIIVVFPVSASLTNLSAWLCRNGTGGFPHLHHCHRFHDAGETQAHVRQVQRVSVCNEVLLQ